MKKLTQLLLKFLCNFYLNNYGHFDDVISHQIIRLKDELESDK